MSVSDTGIGIPPDRLEGVFEEFEQADTSTTLKFGGTGLGLAISRQLTEMMGGTIHVQSDEGHGSTFFVDLPLEVDTGVTLAPPPPATLLATPIVFVSNNELEHDIFSERLTAWGLSVTVASSCAEARTEIRDAGEPPVELPIVLLDAGSDASIVHACTRDDADVLGFADATVFVLVSIESDISEQIRGAAVHTLSILAKPERLMEALVTRRGDASSETPQPTPVHAAPSQIGRVLVAEDNVVNQRLAQRMLEKAGYDVTIVGNGREAVAELAIAAYDVVLMDCNMPEMDSFEATGELRRIEALRELPIVAMTANALEGDRERCLAAGMSDYLRKPFTFDALVETVGRWVPVPKVDPDRTKARERRSVATLDISTLTGSGESDMWIELIDMYLAGTPEEIDALMNSAGSGDLEATAETAHRLKSVSAQLGAQGLAILLAELERLGRANDVSGAKELAPAVESAFRDAVEELNRVRRTLMESRAERQVADEKEELR